MSAGRVTNDNGRELVRRSARKFPAPGRDKPRSNQDTLAILYAGRWFWVSETDIRSKSIFATVMFLFSISDFGAKGLGTIVNEPALG